MFATGVPRNELQASCTHFLSDHPRRAPADVLRELSDYCLSHGVGRDTYGTGDFLNSFEKQIAEYLGMPAAVFMLSGTMAQQIALRIWADRAGSSRIAFHETSHLEANEEHAYRHLHRLDAVFLGEKNRLLDSMDLVRCPAGVSAALIELPMRRLGGTLPSWEVLVAIKKIARDRNMRLHLDGARLWECGPFYRRSPAEICRGFDSVYVSFYKGLGGMTGSMLCGPEDFIAEARVWLRRHGGNLYQQLPYVVSAKLSFDQRAMKFDAYFERALQIGRALGRVPGLVLHPGVPQTPMMHIHLPRTPESLTLARDRIAREDRFWVAGRFFATENPSISMMELVVGDCTLQLSDEEVVAAFQKLLLANASRQIE